MAGTVLPYLIVSLFAVMVNNGSPVVPVNDTVSVGFRGSLVEMSRTADSAPPEVGVNVTLTVQREFASTLPPHVLTTAKSAGFGPSSLVVNVNDALPVLESVSVWGALVASSVTFP